MLKAKAGYDVVAPGGYSKAFKNVGRVAQCGVNGLNLAVKINLNCLYS